jgi:hypothetical protein
LLLPNFALCPLNQRIYIYTTQPRTPTPTPTPPSSTRPHTSTVAAPRRSPPSQPQQFDHRQIARLNDPRLQGLSCAAGDGQCREQTRRRVASIPERPDEMYEIAIRNNMRQGTR